MAKVVGDIAVNVGANIGPLQKNLRKGAAEIEGFGDKASKMARTVGKAGIAVGVGLAGAAAAGYGLAKSAAEAGAEIERLSTIAGLTPEKFQKMASASKSVGIEQDKLADILKDVQDRVGDFLATGGGPMADFFENIAPKVGLTAEKFRELNSADALQLYISSLEKAGVSQNEMTFYLEAMSSDLTNLLPLLSNGGAEMKRLGEEAAAAGAILSNDAVRGSQDMVREFDNLEAAIRNKVIGAILENKEAILNDWIPATLKIIEALGSLIGVIAKVVEGINSAINAYKRFKDVSSGAAPSMNMPAGVNPADQDRVNSETSEWNSGQGDPSTTGTWDVDDFILEGLGDSINGGAGSDTIMNFVPSSDAMAIEQENLSEHLEMLRGILADGLDGKYQLLSEGYDNELRLAETHAEGMRRIEEMTQNQKLQAVAGAFGDLSSLMQTENEKLFKIGKAAAIAEATVSGYKAAVDAWEKGMAVGGPPVAAAFTAASLARTGAMIANIASQQIGGGSTGTSGGGGSGSTAAETTVTNVSEIRFMGSLGADGASLVSLINEEYERGNFVRATVA